MKKASAAKKTSSKSPTAAKKAATRKAATKKATAKKPSLATKKASWSQRPATRAKRPVEPDLDDEDSTPLQPFLELTPENVDLDTAIAALRAVGLLSSYGTHGAIGATLEDVLFTSTSTLDEPFTYFEFPFLDQTEDIINDLNGIVPGPPVCRQIDVTWQWIKIERRDESQRTIFYDTLRDVVNAYDAELQRAGSPWRIATIDLHHNVVGGAGCIALDPAGVSLLKSVGLISGEE